ncbi:MAG: type II toxin-antitoxin system Phd/YefM family antitoxin [Nitrospinota bacterium]
MKITKKSITPSKLRENIYRILDKILETGNSIEIKRHGRRLKIEPVDSVNKLDNLIDRPYLKCKADQIVHLDWSKEWKFNDLP